MALATLSIDLVAKLATLQEGMTRAERLVQVSADRMAKSFDTARTAAGAIGGALGGAFAVTGLQNWLRATVDGIDALNDLNDITGASIENISALEDVALRTGHTLDTVGEAMVKLNKGLADTKPDSETAKALAAIGLQADKLREMDPALAVKEVADALAKYEDDANKARLVQDLFGKSMREVGPLLKDLAEATTLTATVTSEQAAAADRWNKQLAQLQANATGLSRALVGELLPTLNQYLVLIKELSNGPGIMAATFEAMKGNSFSEAGKALDFYSGKLAAVQQQIKAIEADDRPQMRLANRNTLAGLREDEARLQKFTDAYRKTIDSTRAPAPGPARPALSGLGGGGAGGSARAAGRSGAARAPGDASFDDYAVRLSQSVARMVEDSDVVRLGKFNAELAKLDELAAAGLDAAIVADVRAKLLGQMPQPDSPAEAFRRAELMATEATNTELASESLARYNDQRARLAQLLGGTEAAQLEQIRSDMLLLAEAYERGAIAEAQYMQAVQQRLDEASKQGDKTKDAAKEFGLVFKSAFEDAVVEGKDFGSVLKGLEKDLIRIFTRKWVLQPVMAAFDGWLNSLPGLGSLFGGLFATGGAFGQAAPIPFAAGGVFNSPHLFKFANGGAMATGVLGEAGPEAIMPLFRGPGGKLGVQMHGGAGGGVVINQTINVGAGASRNEVAAAMQVAKAQAIAEITDAQTRGRSA